MDTDTLLGDRPIKSRIIHIIWASMIAIVLALACVWILDCISGHTLEQAWDDSRVPVCRTEHGHRTSCD